MIADAVCSVIRANAAIAPNIVRTCCGEGDLGITFIIGSHLSKRFAVSRTVRDFKIGSVLDPGCTVHQIAEGVLQLNGKSFARNCRIVVNVVAVLVGKQMEAAELIPKEGEALEACNVEEISRLQNDTVRCCASGHPLAGHRFIYGEITVEEVHKIFGKAKDTALEVRAAGECIKVYVAPITAPKLFMSVNEKLERGGFIIAVTVCVIEHILKSVFRKVNGGNIRKSYGNINHRGSVFVIDVIFVIADGEIHVFRRIRRLTCKSYNGKHRCDHQNRNQHCNHFCGHSFCVFHNTIPFFFICFWGC